MKTTRLVTLLCTTTALCALAATPAMATNFTIVNGQTVGEQTIGPGASETGTVNSGGTITVIGDNISATTSTSTDGILTNSGTLTTNGQQAHGLFTTATGNTLTSSGSITALGDNSSGLHATASNNSLTNSGTITLSATNNNGLYSNATGNILINSGSIIANSGTGNIGMTSIAANNTLTNRGSITTINTNSYGILSSNNANAIVVNSGSITTTGTSAPAIFSSGSANSNNTNSGTIVTSGTSSEGMRSNGTNSTLTNNGSITTSNTNAHGININSIGTNSTVINNGRIVANSTGNAIRSDAANTTITNAGYVRSVGADTVRMTGSNNTLILKANSTVDGTVFYSGGGTRTLQYDVSGTGSGGSVTRITGAITGAPTTSITNTPTGMRAVQSGNTVVVVTPDQFGGAQAVVSQTVNDAGNLVNNRQQMALLGDATELNGGTQYMASGDSTSDSAYVSGLGAAKRRVVWAEAFGSYQERGKTSDTSDSTARSGGVLAGVDLPQTSEGVRAGFFAGGFGGTLDIGSFKNVNSTGGMAGGYVGQNYGEYYVSGGLNVGFSNNESSRFTSIDTATADYTSYFASPSITIMRPIQKDGYILVPTGVLRYTAQRDGRYREKGSAVNQSVESSTSHSLGARAMVEARFNAKKFENGNALKVALRSGVQGQTQFAGGKTDITLLDNSLSFNSDGGDNTVDGIVGVNVNLARSERLDIYFDAEANLGLNHGGPSENKGVIGRLGAKWKL